MNARDLAELLVACKRDGDRETYTAALDRFLFELRVLIDALATAASAAAPDQRAPGTPKPRKGRRAASGRASEAIRPTEGRTR